MGWLQGLQRGLVTEEKNSGSKILCNWQQETSTFQGHNTFGSAWSQSTVGQAFRSNFKL